MQETREFYWYAAGTGVGDGRPKRRFANPGSLYPRRMGKTKPTKQINFTECLEATNLPA